MALTGKKLEQPIREGESKAEITVDLGEYRIKKVFTAKGERLELMSAEGAVFKTPQTMLDKILGKLSFDPLAFAGMAHAPQRALLAELVGLDFSVLNKEREALYNERTIKNREIKGGDPTSYRKDPNAPLPLESLVGSMEKPAKDTPRQEISMAEELAKVEALEAKVKTFQDYEKKRDELTDERSRLERKTELIQTEIIRLEDQVSEIVKEIMSYQEDRVSTCNEISKISEAIQALPVPEEISQDLIAETRKGLLEVEEKNKAIRKALEFDKAIESLEAAKKEVARLEEGMMRIDLEKQNKIKGAKFPIDDLGMTDEFVTYQGMPFSQLSTGGQIRVSTAVAMALNPTLKIILVREGSLLDSDGLKAIIEIAKEKDYQLWIEKVGEDKNVGIYLEEGEIKE